MPEQTWKEKILDPSQPISGHVHLQMHAGQNPTAANISRGMLQLELRKAAVHMGRVLYILVVQYNDAIQRYLPTK